MLLDKGYFDYDFEKVEKEEVRAPRSDEEIRDILAGFGVATASKKPETLEEIQEHIINQIKED